MDGRREIPRGLLLRGLLVLTLLLVGIWQGYRASLLQKEAEARAYGLVDNSGRTAWVRFQLDPIWKGDPFPVLLMYVADYNRYTSIALKEKKNLAFLTYMGGPSLLPISLSYPYNRVALLSGDGILVWEYTCPQRICTVVPPMAYSAFIELPWDIPLLQGASLEVVKYGEWVER